ncbi:MAG: HAD hydrolase-like protein [Halocynthiibacter sp.]
MHKGTVVFDLDGTLADTSGDLLAAANACFQALGAKDVLDLKADALTAFHGGRAMLRLGFERIGATDIEAKVDTQFQNLLDYYEANIAEHSVLYDGVEEALEDLKTAGYSISVCTNKPEYLARILLPQLGLSDLNDALVGADTLPTRKPDVAPYWEAVARANGGGKPSLLVGDTATDRDTAKAAGVPSVLVTFGPEGRAIERLQPEALLDHYRDLSSLVDDLLV